MRNSMYDKHAFEPRQAIALLERIKYPTINELKILIYRKNKIIEVTREEWDRVNGKVEPIMAMVNSDASDVTTVFRIYLSFNWLPIIQVLDMTAALLCPKVIGVYTASDIEDHLRDALAKLRDDIKTYERLYFANEFSYCHFVEFLTAYAEACSKHPDAKIVLE